MSLFTIFQIASQGMTAQRERLEAASANLANANSTRAGTSGKPYQRRDIVFTTQNVTDQWQSSAAQSGIFDGKGGGSPGVKSEVVLADENSYVKQYDPHNVDADADGYVKMPDVDPIEETVNMMSAARSFEANATVFGTAKEIARVSLSLGDA